MASDELLRLRRIVRSAKARSMRTETDRSLSYLKCDTRRTKSGRALSRYCNGARGQSHAAALSLPRKRLDRNLTHHKTTNDCTTEETENTRHFTSSFAQVSKRGGGFYRRRIERLLTKSGVLTSYDFLKYRKTKETGPGQDNVTKYVVPKRFKIIGEGVFYGFRNYSSSGRIPDIEIVLHDDIEIIESSAFRQCLYLAPIKLPTHLKEIRESAFEGAHLQVITIPPEVRRIESRAFFGAATLGTIDLRNARDLDIIDQDAFSNCVLNTLKLPIYHIPHLNLGAFDSTTFTYAPGRIIIERPFSGARSYPVPRRVTKRNGLVTWIVDTQRTLMIEERKLASSLWSVVHMLTIVCPGIVNAYPATIASVLQFWFRGERLGFPIRGADHFRAAQARRYDTVANKRTRAMYEDSNDSDDDPCWMSSD